MEIVVLGAGYAGMTAALGLAGRTKRRDDVRIRLVNADERFVERVRLHQVASGQKLTHLHIPDRMMGTRVEFVRGWVSGVDADARSVRLADGGTLSYDRLVVALGAVTDTRVPGVQEHAYTLDSMQSSTAFARQLATLGTGTVVVVGGGLTGVESASEIAQQHPQLRVVLATRGEPAAMMGPRARAYVRTALERLGVEIRVEAEVVKVLPGGVALADEHLDADLVLWTGGVRAAGLAGEGGFTVDGQGRIVTDRTLRSLSHPEVYAVGDAAAVPQNYGIVHGTCGTGVALAGHAAANLAGELRGKQPAGLRFGYFHQNVSLGRGDAVTQFTRPNDSPSRWILTGRVAAAYKEGFSRSPWPLYKVLPRTPRVLVWRHGGRATKVAA
ncbi:MAG TPA: FAD-dependent oxidoreductase [Sporichthyaceae bacterium]|jgi:NADH dehydrogenase FAD-containing subunit